MDYPLDISEMSIDEVREIKKFFNGVPSEIIRIGPQGYVFHKFENLMAQLSFFYNMEIRKTDTFVASFPRSGTTMTQELVWLIGNNLDYETASSKYLCERYVSLRACVDHWLVKPTMLEEYQQRKCKHFEKLRKMTLPTEILADTNHSRFIKSHIPFCMLPPKTLDTAKVVYVARNPLDVAVSLFHFYRSRKMHEFVGDFKTFWTFFSNGLTMWTPYFAHVKQAWENRHHPNMLFLFYEDITKNLPGAIRRISVFLGKSYSDDQIKGLCEHMKFENFQKNESVNLDFLKEFDVFVPDEQSFIRKGKTGGWRDYFDEELIKQAASWVTDNLRDTDLSFPELEALLKANQQ